MSLMIRIMMNMVSQGPQLTSRMYPKRHKFDQVKKYYIHTLKTQLKMLILCRTFRIPKIKIGRWEDFMNFAENAQTLIFQSVMCINVALGNLIC